ncbi:MAG: hypothetical protein J6W28_06410 [Clostridia bacterium]|nr:hypothetical protein [Clostridia bacterium]
MAFQNFSYYVLPLSYTDESAFQKGIEADPAWRPLSRDERCCNYLFDYVSRIIKSDDACRAYTLQNPKELPVYLFEKEAALSASPSIEAVSLYLFATGVAFLEYKISYGNLSPKEIVNFAYYFKGTRRADKKSCERGDKESLYTVSHRLLGGDGSNARLFFTNESHLKHQAFCFHAIKADYETDAQRDRLLFLLKRSYTDSFAYDESSDSGDYDMTYLPYDYMAFGGCQEGFAALCRDTDNENANYFLNEYFGKQLCEDYHYLYLILLNQRFSGIKYIAEIATTDDTRELVEQVSRKIIHLKTRYSFHVVSDDYIYQNIYSKMYTILDIDKLFLDIEENSDRLSLVQSNENAETEKENGNFLMYISFLAVFSALIDLASYLDRMSVTALVSTLVSGVFVLFILGYAIVRRLRKKRKKP